MSNFTVVRQNGTSVLFKAEVALSPSEQAYGLMFAKKLETDTGMIFPFPEPKPASFWMKNTFIPLDLLFIKTDGTIAKIVASARPKDETPMSSPGLVTAVIEINGGLSKKMGIREGDKVFSPVIKTGNQAEVPAIREE
ncbi:MAG: DUF192 domain-containing protein [Alphaproteobacteria bacterium]|nr:DUF192 domain-containing protein [Alphaproteobacteria bacterium]